MQTRRQGPCVAGRRFNAIHLDFAPEAAVARSFGQSLTPRGAERAARSRAERTRGMPAGSRVRAGQRAGPRRRPLEGSALGPSGHRPAGKRMKLAPVLPGPLETRRRRRRRRASQRAAESRALNRVRLLPDPTPWEAPAALTPRPPLHTGSDSQSSILRGCGPVERGRRARRFVRLRWDRAAPNWNIRAAGSRSGSPPLSTGPLCGVTCSAFLARVERGRG